MIWSPKPVWEGLDAYIIGGGTSLRTFDWGLLADTNTIGCNAAFMLGHRTCKVCMFVDAKFCLKYEQNLASFGGLVVTNNEALKSSKHSWVLWMARKDRGLHKSAIGYNESCGASAINLALILGARRVFLLGMDLSLDDRGRQNWHTHGLDKPSKEIFPRFVRGFGQVAHDLPRVFPGRQVINVNDNSRLKCFPTQTIEQHFGSMCNGTE